MQKRASKLLKTIIDYEFDRLKPTVTIQFIVAVLLSEKKGNRFMIELKEVTEEDFYEVIQLKVSDDQEKSRFVAPNVRSLAECWLYRKNEDVFPYAVYNGDEVVGFLLLDLDAEESEYMIWRMMVDAKHQGKGYGRQIVEAVMEMARNDEDYDVLIADYVDGNAVMKYVLESLGFERTGFDEEYNEVLMKLDVRK